MRIHKLTTLLAAVTLVCIALCVGSTLGILAGFVGRRVNMLIMRTMDIFYAFPSVLLAIAIAGALRVGLGNTIMSGKGLARYLRRGTVRFQPLPIRTAREVFPQAAHPVSFVERVMGRVVHGSHFHS